MSHGVSDLSSGVDDFGREFLALVEDLVTESILNRRVIAFDEVTLTVLHSQG